MLTITWIDTQAPKKPEWPVWPDEEWVLAILGSKLGAPERVGLVADREEGLCLCFDFGAPLDATVVLSLEPGRRRGAHIAERSAPFCWSPSEIKALLDEIAEGRGWTTLEACMASLTPPEKRP